MPSLGASFGAAGEDLLKKLEDYHDGIWAGCLEKLMSLDPEEGVFDIERI
jgi:hypothetical protein